MVKSGYLAKYKRQIEEQRAKERFRKLKQSRERCLRHHLLNRLREQQPVPEAVPEPEPVPVPEPEAEPEAEPEPFPSDIDFALGYIPRYPTSRVLEYFDETMQFRQVGVNTNYDIKTTVSISKGVNFESIEVVEDDDKIKIIIKNKN